MISPRDECLTSALYGLHYTRPSYSIAKAYGDILDAFTDNDDVELQVHTHDTKLINFTIDGVGVQVTTGSITVFTNIFIKKSLAELVGISLTKPDLSDVWGAPFNTKPIDFVDSVKKNRKQFREDAERVCKVISLILEEESPSVKFVGYIENYLLPISAYEWSIMTQFDAGAKLFGDADIHEKKARNRYIISRNDNGSLEKNLIFEIHKPYVSPDRVSSYAAAHFDYQHWTNGDIKVHEVDYAESFRKLEGELSDMISGHKVMQLVPMRKR